MNFDFDIKLSKSELNKGLILPKLMSKELAEIIGIHFGDGYLQIKPQRYYRIYHSFNMRDREYTTHVKNLFYYIFNVNMSIEERINRNTLSLYLHSKGLCTFFSKVLKIPAGPKKVLSIPYYIKSNKEFLKCFLRGLFDTDGCIVTQIMVKYQYKLIKICTKLDTFAEEIKAALKSLQIEAYISHKKTGYDVTVRKKDSFNRFIELIEPKNNKGKVGTQGFEVQCHKNHLWHP